jgi:hypothetical protein
MDDAELPHINPWAYNPVSFPTAIYSVKLEPYPRIFFLSSTLSNYSATPWAPLHAEKEA